MMEGRRPTRRVVLGGAAGLAAFGRVRAMVRAAETVAFSYPLAWPDKRPGEAFYVKHGYACQNTESYPGLAHTGENWYSADPARTAAGAPVLATAAGEVVYADYDYPGHVVIVRHAPALYSMYGHLALDLAVATGDKVRRGQPLGNVLDYPGDTTRSHLHFELRTFLTEETVNGDQPSHGFTCGLQCPPGPGYWPLDAPEQPSDLGWRNPTHVIAHRMFPDGARAAATDALVTADIPPAAAPVWSAPPWRDNAKRTGEAKLAPGDRLRILQVAAGPEAARDHDAAGYRLWYRLRLANGHPGWVQAARATADAVNADGAPAAIRFSLLPVVGI